MSSLFKKPKTIIPPAPPPAAVTPEPVTIPTPAVTPPTLNSPDVVAARKRAERSTMARQGREDTILTSPQGIGSSLKPKNNIGATLLGS